MNLKHPFLKIILIPGLALLLATMPGCKSDKADDCKNCEQELITTVQLEFKPSGGSGVPLLFAVRDLDGPGGNSPLADTIRIPALAAYEMNVRLLDESKNPAVDIGAEVATEAADHLLLFAFTGVDVIHAYADTDGAGGSLGLKNTLQVGPASKGSLKVTLKHNPDKSNPANTGETDAEVVFPLIFF